MILHSNVPRSEAANNLRDMGNDSVGVVIQDSMALNKHLMDSISIDTPSAHGMTEDEMKKMHQEMRTRFARPVSLSPTHPLPSSLHLPRLFTQLLTDKCTYSFVLTEILPPRTYLHCSLSLAISLSTCTTIQTRNKEGASMKITSTTSLPSEINQSYCKTPQPHLYLSISMYSISQSPFTLFLEPDRNMRLNRLHI